MNWTQANIYQLNVIIFADKDCPKHLKEEAKAELRKRKKNPNIKYVEKR